MFVNRTCNATAWNKEDLYAILVEDFYKLVSVRWIPDETKPFHALMLRQFQNKCRNFAKYQKSKKVLFYKAMSSLSDEFPPFCKETQLNHMIFKESVANLVEFVGNSEVKHKQDLLDICTLILNGYNITRTRQTLNLPIGTFNRRLVILQDIIKQLEGNNYEKRSNFRGSKP